MIIDARTLPLNAIIESDICVIGAGPAGITLAREFEGGPLRVVLLEGGGMDFDQASQSLYQGENIGLCYDALDRTRSRYFGGSSNCWGGFCRPLDAHDFQVRDWVPNSGWPFGLAELLPYYRRAHALLQIGPFEYDPQTWQDWIGRPDSRFIPFDREQVLNIVSQLSPPTRFGRIYGEAIARSGNVTAFLHANVTAIEAPGNGSQVTGVEVRTLSGAAFRVAARCYVLATGGIETPRLLLASNRHHPAGLGNEHDLVGRYFMDHPRIRNGEIVFSDPRAFSRIYDVHVTYPGGTAARGTKISSHFGLSPAIQGRERLGNTRCYVTSRFVGDHPESYAALKLLYQALNRGSSLRGRRGEVLRAVARNLPRVAVLAVGLKFRPGFLARGFTLETVVEPSPLPDSRVMLGEGRDRLGVPRVRVDWRLGEMEKRTFRRTQEILGAELERIGAGTVRVAAPREGEPWPETLDGCWHHMGTTRMHADPRQGVVDPSCRVHGMENLFIAGSSVFPTGGSDMPTITIVALALRLAEHIKAGFAYSGRDLSVPVPVVAALESEEKAAA
ncbi:GMC family oxidoreductase [Rhodovastum atsumiense]|uniref:GMC family oxidoreductase n=1 Tax=Rhodovastum atsumiense TaxID=504468 RepID=A0A5M6IKX0_9PROT|nr:GMC family oxidoreductase [Rhodovastum atsumiense]